MLATIATIAARTRGALAKVSKTQTGRGPSIAGIVLAFAALIMCVLQSVVFASAVNNVQQQFS